jgi:hypothetical protein
MQAARLCVNHAPHDAAYVRAQILRFAPSERAALALLPDNPKPFDHLVKPMVTDQTTGSTPGVSDRLVCDDGFSSVAVDTEANRIMLALGLGTLARVYWTAHELNRRGDGAGKVSESALVDTLVGAGVDASAYTIRHNWIKDGCERGLWKRDGKGNLYLLSYKAKLPDLLTRLVLEAGKPGLIVTNRVGSKFIETPIAGSTKQWYGNSLAAWHNSRADHTRRISRATLQMLWGVTRKTLASWEREAGIEVVKCYANFTDDDAVPEHAYPAHYFLKGSDGKVEERDIPRARISNIYNAPSMNERQHQATPRKAYRRTEAALERAGVSVDLPDSVSGATSGNAGVGFCTRRRSFYADDGVIQDAFGKLHDHLQSHWGDKAPHFVSLGWDDKARAWLYEQSSSGFQKTSIKGRAPLDYENRYFAARGGRAAFAAGWRGS